MACLEGGKNRGYKGKNRARQRRLEPWEQKGQGVGQTSVSKHGQGLSEVRVSQVCPVRLAWLNMPGSLFSPGNSSWGLGTGGTSASASGAACHPGHPFSLYHVD